MCAFGFGWLVDDFTFFVLLLELQEEAVFFFGVREEDYMFMMSLMIMMGKTVTVLTRESLCHVSFPLFLSHTFLVPWI